MGHQEQEFLVRAGKGDDDGVVIRDLDVDHIADFRIGEGGFFRDGVGEFHIVCGAGSAIGEFNAGRNVEGEDLTVVADFPGISQSRNDVAGFRVDLDQGLMREGESHHVGIGIGCLRIERGDIIRDTDRDGILRRGGSQDHDESQQEAQKNNRLLHFNLL